MKAKRFRRFGSGLLRESLPVSITPLGFARAREMGIFAGMSAEGSTHLILLAGVFGVLVVILVVLGSISRSLMRMERRMEKQEVAKAATEPAPIPAPGSGSSSKKISQRADFLSFLSEDPQRRKLPKREQFAAYRKWRKEKGLSWPQSAESQTET